VSARAPHVRVSSLSLSLISLISLREISRIDSCFFARAHRWGTFVASSRTFVHSFAVRKIISVNWVLRSTTGGGFRSACPALPCPAAAPPPPSPAISVDGRDYFTSRFRPRQTSRRQPSLAALTRKLTLERPLCNATMISHIRSVMPESRAWILETDRHIHVHSKSSLAVCPFDTMPR